MAEIKYMKQGVGLLGIKPCQVAKDIREIESDDGAETTLRIEKTDTYLCMTIIQYNADLTERMRSKEWRVDALHHGLGIPIKKKEENCWSLVGKDGVTLDVYIEADGDIIICIYSPIHNELSSRVPPFIQVTHGGQSKVFCKEVVSLKDTLRDQYSSVSPDQKANLYINLERLYDAIGMEHRFRVLDS